MLMLKSCCLKSWEKLHNCHGLPCFHKCGTIEFATLDSLLSFMSSASLWGISESTVGLMNLTLSIFTHFLTATLWNTRENTKLAADSYRKSITALLTVT